MYAAVSRYAWIGGVMRKWLVSVCHVNLLLFLFNSPTHSLMVTVIPRVRHTFSRLIGVANRNIYLKKSLRVLFARTASIFSRNRWLCEWHAHQQPIMSMANKRVQRSAIGLSYDVLKMFWCLFPYQSLSSAHARIPYHITPCHTVRSLFRHQYSTLKWRWAIYLWIIWHFN